MLRQSTTQEVLVEKGQLADLSMIVCADPRPRVVAWEWGSLRLEAGAEMGKNQFFFVSLCNLKNLYLFRTSLTNYLSMCFNS